MEVAEHEEMMALVESLKGALARVSREPFDLDTELKLVTRVANDWAVDHGLRTVTIKQVEILDRISTGSDWGFKLSLRVAEMVYGVSAHELPRR